MEDRKCRWDPCRMALLRTQPLFEQETMLDCVHTFMYLYMQDTYPPTHTHIPRYTSIQWTVRGEHVVKKTHQMTTMHANKMTVADGWIFSKEGCRFVQNQNVRLQNERKIQLWRNDSNSDKGRVGWKLDMASVSGMSSCRWAMERRLCTDTGERGF